MLHFLIASTLFFAVVIGHTLPDHPSVEGYPVIDASPSAKFVDGNQTPISNVPYLVSIGVIDNATNVYTHRCAGAIISKKWILTAAKCSPSEQDVIVAGVSDLNQFDLSTHHKIRKVIVHPHFSMIGKSKSVNDIALVRVKEPFEFGDSLKAISKLFKENQEAVENSTATISGWGTTNSTGQVTYIKVPIIRKSVCNKIYHAKFSYNGHICGGYLQKTYSQWIPCRSDLGGPVIVNGRLAGIVSWGPVPCTKVGYPSVFTEIAYYRNWIKRNTHGQ